MASLPGHVCDGAGGAFTPLVLELAEPLDLGKVKVRFDYSASDPDGVTREGDGTPLNPHIYKPAGGHLRIWKKDGMQDRKKADAGDPEGDYVKPGIDYAATNLGTGRMILLYVEGIQNSAALGDQRIKVEVNPAVGGAVCEDAVRCTVIKVDLDVDSDNNNAFAPPEGSDKEDQIEDRSGNNDYPGKYVEVNHKDTDQDGIPDYAYGFDWDGTSGNADDECASAEFTPLPIEIKEPVDIEKAVLKITYSISDPAALTRSAEPNYKYTLPEGYLRIWTNNASAPRNKNSVLALTDPGAFVPPATYEDLSKLGFLASSRTVLFYVEAVKPSASVADQCIRVELDPDGDGPAEWVAADAARITAVKAYLAACQGQP